MSTPLFYKALSPVNTKWDSCLLLSSPHLTELGEPQLTFFQESQFLTSILTYKCPQTRVY